MAKRGSRSWPAEIIAAAVRLRHRIAAAFIATRAALQIGVRLVWVLCGVLTGTNAVAAINYVQGNSTSPGTTQSTVSATYAAAQTAGNLNVVVVSWNNSTSTVQSVSDTRGNVYTQAIAPTVLSGVATIAVYYSSNIVAASANANTVTLTLSAAAPYPDVRIAEYSGIDAANPFDGGIGDVGNSAVSSSDVLGTSNANDLLVAVNYAETPTSAPGADYTQRLISADGHILEDRIVTAVDDYSATATLSSSGAWAMQLVAFRAAAGGGGDTQPPTVPGSLNATATSSTQVDLSWTASTDNVAVTGYLVERCQGAGCSSFSQIATPSTTSYSDPGRTASTSYSYRVRAQDAVPNYSNYSNTSSVTTPAVGDTQPPTTPGALAITAGANQNALSWTASTDNVGVTAYLIERCDGAGCSSFAQIDSTASTSYTDSTAAAGISYSYRVRARDAVPNYSGYSSTGTATPADCD